MKTAKQKLRNQADKIWMKKEEELALKIVMAIAKKNGTNKEAITIGSIWIYDFLRALREARIMILRGRKESKLNSKIKL